MRPGGRGCGVALEGFSRALIRVCDACPCMLAPQGALERWHPAFWVGVCICVCGHLKLQLLLLLLVCWWLLVRAARLMRLSGLMRLLCVPRWVCVVPRRSACQRQGLCVQA